MSLYPLASRLLRHAVRMLLVGLCAVTTLGTAASSGRAADAAPDAVALVVDLLGRDDVEFRAIALERVRLGLTGEAATSTLAALISKLPPPRQVELLGALAERGDKAALPAITAVLLASREPAVRVAAITALGMLGGGTEVAILKRSLTADEPEKSAARRGLTALRGTDAGRQLVEAAKFGDPAVRPVYIDILADRRERAALADLVVAAVEPDANVRAAAMRTLARIGGPEQVAGMTQGVLKAAAGGERDAAERALVSICTQGAQKDAAAAAFLQAFQAAGDGDRETLLSPLGRIGGPAALAIVDGLIADTDPGKRKMGLVAITRWPDATVAPRLLDLLAKARDAAERDQVLGALIRIAPLPDNKLSDGQKLALLQKTMSLCEKQEDRARVLERANAIRIVETLRFVAPYLDDPQLAEAACKSVVELAHHQKLRDPNKAEFVKALDKVIATTKNTELVERANRYKEGKTWERKKG
jgi:HEAT repeat protein